MTAELEKGAQEGLAPENGEAVVQAVRVEFSGPLPHPQVLAQYNDAVSDGAERIVRLAENQAQHRQALEARGQAFTFALAMVSLLGGIFLIALGNSAAGLVPLVAAIAGLGGIFVFRELQIHRDERESP
ncbi:MAG TPA: DUF2335 domain-containing protein [Solirubrobacterales bacterium]|nr:DUF2335 domain-containing protein [Solirubrobacterales bacterium]